MAELASDTTRQPRSVAFINNFAGPRFGGGEVHLINLASGLAQRGLDVTAVVMPESGVADRLRAAGIRVIEEDVMDGSPPAVSRRVVELLADIQPQIIHGTGYYTNLLARLVGQRLDAHVVNAIHCEVRAVLTYQKGLLGRARQAAREIADRTTLDVVDAFIANADLLTDGLRELGVADDRIFVAHNGVEPEALREQAAERAVRAGAPPVVGTLGRLEAVKGFDIFLDAVALVLEKHPAARFVIAGQGSLGDHLADRISSDAVLADAVEMPGFVEDSAAFLSSLDVFCLSSLSEGFNTTVLEAQALGVPVVATDVGGTSEAVVDAKTGLLVPSGDAEALARGIVSLLDDPARANELAQAGRGRVETSFTVERMVDTTVDVYTTILARAGTA